MFTYIALSAGLVTLIMIHLVVWSVLEPTEKTRNPVLAVVIFMYTSSSTYLIITTIASCKGYCT